DLPVGSSARLPEARGGRGGRGAPGAATLITRSFDTEPRAAPRSRFGIAARIACAACMAWAGLAGADPAGGASANTDRGPQDAARDRGSEWVNVNPGGGGAFTAIGAGPTGVIVAGSDLAGACRSLDHGASWEVIGAAHGLAHTHVS